MLKRQDTYTFTITVNEDKREYDITDLHEMTQAEMLDAIGIIMENTPEASSYVVVLSRKITQVEEHLP